MWDERFLFVLFSLLSIGTFVLVPAGRDGATAPRRWWPLVLLWVGAFIFLCGRIYVKGWEFPDLGVFLSILFGVVFGTFISQFVLRLFGPGFNGYDGIITAASLLILAIAYSVPSYTTLWHSIFENLGGTTIKTPLLEFGFAESSRKPPPFAVSGDREAGIGGIPLPNDSRAALRWVSRGVGDIDKGYLARDAAYIRFIDTEEQAQTAEKILQDTAALLRPVQILVGCAVKYSEVIHDSKLMLIDVSPASVALLRLHFEVVDALKHRPEAGDDKATSASMARLKVKWQSLANAMKSVLEQIHRKVQDEQKLSSDCDQRRIDALAFPQSSNGLLYLQPYTTIAAADLLWVHGSRDEALYVLAEWVDAWNCAHGKASLADETCVQHRADDLIKRLPNWFGYRAEFELSAIAFEVAGPENQNYNNYISDFSDRFKKYLANAAQPLVFSDLRKENGCAELLKKVSASNRDHAATAKYLSKLLLENEDTVTQSQRSFVKDLQKPGIKSVLESSRMVVDFPVECVPKQATDHWISDQAVKRINVGLLELAAAARVQTIAASPDDRRWADEIRTQAREDLEFGQKKLWETSMKNAPEHAEHGLTSALFNSSQEKEYYTKASRALDQLNEAER